MEIFRSPKFSVHNITPGNLAEMMSTGHSVVQDALDKDTVALLGKSMRTKALIPHIDGGSDFYRMRHSLNRMDSRLTSIRHPELSRLMRETGVSIREAAKEIEDPTLMEWGIPGVYWANDTPEYRRLRARVNLMHRNGFLGEHRDKRFPGVVVVFDFVGEGEVRLHPGSSGARSLPQLFSLPDYPASIELLTPGDGILFSGAKNVRDPKDAYSEEHPWHGVKNISDHNRYSAVIYESRSPAL
jgi:hypothetical protein